MTPTWTAADLEILADDDELEIAAPRADGSRGRWTPIWVVVVDGAVFVRTWRRRTTGWYGHAVAARRAGVRVSGREVEVDVALVAATGAAEVDAAYTIKYGRAGSGLMITEESRLSTLRLDPSTRG